MELSDPVRRQLNVGTTPASPQNPSRIFRRRVLCSAHKRRMVRLLIRKSSNNYALGLPLDRPVMGEPGVRYQGPSLSGLWLNALGTTQLASLCRSLPRATGSHWLRNYPFSKVSGTPADSGRPALARHWSDIRYEIERRRSGGRCKGRVGLVEVGNHATGLGSRGRKGRIRRERPLGAFAQRSVRGQ